MGKQKILIADDEMDNVILLEKRLKASGFDTITAADGDEAVEQTFKYIPDLVLLDIMMPKKDGYEVLRCLREDDKTKDIPVILLTAKAETPDKVKGLELGAVDYVTKPFDYKELLARIKSNLESRKEVDEQIKEEKLTALSAMMEGVAHEVRNPLTVIGGFSKKLLTMTLPDDPRYPYIVSIEKGVSRIERMIKDIYDFKTMMIIKNREEYINQCVNEVLLQLQTALKDKNIQLTLFMDKTDSKIFMDKNQFMRAIKNIIGNSIDAMTCGGILSIKTTTGAKVFTITIADSGSGIKEEELKFVFDPFFTSKMEGTGLGLTLALKIIQEHNGNIYIKSEKNTGTIVTVELELA
jgi:two-component system sensor histidine kinase/response regulator